jgi:hypothetical protein
MVGIVDLIWTLSCVHTSCRYMTCTYNIYILCVCLGSVCIMYPDVSANMYPFTYQTRFYYAQWLTVKGLRIRTEETALKRTIHPFLCWLSHGTSAVGWFCRFFSKRRNATTTNQNRWSNTEQFELVDGWKLEFRVQPPAQLVLQVDVSHWTLTTKMGRIHERWTEHVIWGMKNAISDFLWRHSVTWINQIEYNSSHQVPVTNTPLRLLALGSHAHQIHRAPQCSSWHALVLSTAKPGTDAQNSIIPLAFEPWKPAWSDPFWAYTLLCTWVHRLCMYRHT